MHDQHRGVVSSLHKILNLSQVLHIIYLGILIRRGSPGLEGRVGLLERGIYDFLFKLFHTQENMCLLIYYKITSTFKGKFEEDIIIITKVMLRLKDLDPLYQSVTEDEGILIANLGALCWQTCKKELFTHWSTEEEATKADGWKEAGKQIMLDSLKGKLEEGIQTKLLLTESEYKLSQIKEGLEGEIERRTKERLETLSLTLELQRVVPLQQRLSVLESKEELLGFMKNQIDLQNESIKTKEKELTVLQATLDQLKSTNKSSHAIGKIGEATVFSMLEEYIIPEFPFSRVEDKTGVSHAADFHVWLMPCPNKTVKILIDAKKYKTNVKMSEIQKLHSDVDADPEATAGLMISLDSGMCNFKQFEIGKSPKNKLIMYVTMENMDPTEQVNGLIRALRVLSSIAAVNDIEQQRSMLENIEIFVSEIDKSVKDMDRCITSQQKALDLMRGTKEKLFTRLDTFRNGTILLNLDEELVSETIKCKGIKGDGLRCPYNPISGYEFCKRHGAT